MTWSDKKVFSADKDGRYCVWRFKNERYKEQNVIPTRKSGRVTAAMWGWMSKNSLGELTEITRRMNSTEYEFNTTILENIMIPSVRSVYSEEDMPQISFM